jgi:arginine transport system substrate-binding protein
VPYDSDESALSALKEGRAYRRDGRSGDFLKWLQDNPDYAMMDNVTDPAITASCTAFAVRKDDPELLNNMNAALEALKRSPDFQAMEQKWFK